MYTVYKVPLTKNFPRAPLVAHDCRQKGGSCDGQLSLQRTVGTRFRVLQFIFALGFSCCPYYQGVRYSAMFARRELTVVGLMNGSGIFTFPAVSKMSKARYSPSTSTWCLVVVSENKREVISHKDKKKRNIIFSNQIP